MSGWKGYEPYKRALDIVGSAMALAASIPVELAVGVAIALKLGRPVLFRQQRPGIDGKLFTLIKFRTMLPIDEERGLVSDADRLIPFGRSLRSASIDELPTLWNVLVGDMSFVGPRPLLPEYIDLYTPEQARRHKVRPGITGLAQVAGRNNVDWEQRFALDITYVETRSLLLDARIIWQTMRLVLTREGISAHGDATVACFRGTASRSER